MATTTGSHSVAAFTAPVNGTSPIDANAVKANDNTLRVAYVNHDADTGIHVQSSDLASRPAAGVAGRKWITTDSNKPQFWYDNGTAWLEVGDISTTFTATTVGAVSSTVYSYTLQANEFLTVAYEYYADNASGSAYRFVNSLGIAYFPGSGTAAVSIGSFGGINNGVSPFIPVPTFSASGATVTLVVTGLAGQTVRHRVVYTATVTTAV